MAIHLIITFASPPDGTLANILAYKAKNHLFIVAMMTSADIRKNFLEFFKNKQHHIVPSAPIVIKNDPTLMFTNAGMNQFKDYFLGNKPAPYPRVADTQKCLRVSGKHNDLEEVGVDTYHHTMFEMLGNWSFGDYFKKEAIEWSWELLTKVLHIPIDQLYVTVFEGDVAEGLPKDEEAYNEWKKWIPEDRILLGNKKDNFWEMGDTGPCGPCTEIHVDTRPEEERKKQDGSILVNADHPQVIEIWNNVFIQYNRLKNGTLEQLPARHVDTGMGFERLVRVIQKKESNYDTDVFTGIIEKIETITGKKYEAAGPTPALPKREGAAAQGSLTQEANNSKDIPNQQGLSDGQVSPIGGDLEGAGGGLGEAAVDIAIRVNADHLRAICFTIADGQLPSNTGAGYVIRRILRRAVRYYYSYLDYKQPLLHQLIPVLATQFQEVFPELKQQQDFVTKVVKEEEEAFLRTLYSGLHSLSSHLEEKNKEEEAIFSGRHSLGLYIEEKDSQIDEELTAKGVIGKPPTHLLDPNYTKQLRVIDGNFAFELYDTYGFPLDLTKMIAHESDYEVDEIGFNKAMQQQKNRSRAAAIIDAGDWIVVNDTVTQNEFIGYNFLETDATILRYRKVKAKGKEVYQVVLDRTPFYAESGGQVGDTGILQFNGGNIIVTDTKKENDLILHFTEKLPEDISGEVIAKVDEDKRKKTALHHSATHLLHAALRNVLGTHVAQKGSLVTAGYLRFDFSHFAKLSPEEIRKVESLVNGKIRENIPVIITYMSKEKALQSGAMALFGEKYGDTVRVVTIDPAYSIELCGGTHVGFTGELGFFKINSETAVAAGVRRIEAICGWAAEQYVTEQLQQLQAAKELLKNPTDIIKAVATLQEENAALKKELEKFELAHLKTIKETILQKVQTINGCNFIGEVVEVAHAEALKKLAFDLKPHLADYVIALAAAIEGKASIVLLFDEAIAEKKSLDAAGIIKQKIAPLIKGGGGGQKTLATAGGQNASALHQVIDTVKSLL